MTITKKIVGVFLTVSVLAIAWVLFGNPENPLPEGSQSQQYLTPGSYIVETLKVDLIDRTRSTQSNANYVGEDQRLLATTIRYPSADRNADKSLFKPPFPLIIHSHGFSSNRDDGAHIATFLTTMGFIVVAADFPLTHFDAPGGPMVKDVVNQPADIRFLIDSLLTMNNTPGHPLHQQIDSARIAVMGISLGGMTTTMVAYDPNRRDPRIKAAISLAGPTSMFSRRFFSTSDMPFLMLASPQDALVNYEDNALPILNKIDNAVLVSLDKASHTGIADTAKYMRWMKNPDALGCYIVMKNLNLGEKPWFDLIGGEEDGVTDSVKPRLCEQDPLPESMNPLRQHQLTLLAVSRFLISVFADDPELRQQSQHYLLDVMQQELHDVHVDRSSPANL